VAKEPKRRAVPFGSPSKTFTRPPTEEELERRRKYSHGVAVVASLFVFISMVHTSLKDD